MNATVSLINSGLDVAINSAQLFISVCNFAYCLGVAARHAAEATYEAGKATRQWVDDIIADAETPQAQAPTVTIPVISDPWDGEATPVNNIVPFPAMPRLLAPATVAGYLAPCAETVSATRKTDALKELVAAHQANVAELLTITTDFIQDKENDLATCYEDMGIRELRQIAKAKGIAKSSRKSKATLVRELATV